MEKSKRIEEHKLTRDRFVEFPVWAPVEDTPDDLVAPVEKLDPLPSDELRLYIKADFFNPRGDHFEGYVVANIRVYAVEMFVGDEKFGFNLGLGSLAPDMLEKLRNAIGDEGLELFPLRYETKFRFAGEDLVAGTFEPRGWRETIAGP